MQASELTSDLNDRAEAFRNRALGALECPVLRVGALHEKARAGGKHASMAAFIVCAVNGEGMREAVAIEPMMEESASAYIEVFRKLKELRHRAPSSSFRTRSSGLVAAIKKEFIGSGSGRGAEARFMRNILARVPQKGKDELAAEKMQDSVK